MKRSPPPKKLPPQADQLDSRDARALAKSKKKLAAKHLDTGASTLSNTSEDEQCSYQSDRQLGQQMKTGPEEGDIRSAVSEMRILFANLQSKTESQFNTLQASMVTVKTELAEISSSLYFLTQKYEEFQSKLTSLEKEKQEDRQYIQTLETRVEMLERKSRNSCLEIRNVDQVSHSETKQQLCDIITKLGSSISMTLNNDDIKDIYRVNTKKETHRPIVVEFATVIKKEAVIRSIRMLNKGKKKEDKLNSRHLQMDGPPKPVFVSESLSQKARKLLYLARDFAKTNDYRFCWSSNGIIYLRKAENTPLIRVLDEEVLERLLKNK